MKKILYISIVVIFFFIVCYFLPPKPYNLEDCLEFGFCAEGLKLKENNKEYIMTKNYCIDNNYTWLEDIKVCNVRKATY